MEINDRILKASDYYSNLRLVGAQIVDVVSDDLFRVRQVDGEFSLVRPSQVQSYISNESWVQRVAEAGGVSQAVAVAKGYSVDEANTAVRRARAEYRRRLLDGFSHDEARSMGLNCGNAVLAADWIEGDQYDEPQSDIDLDRDLGLMADARA